MTRAQRIAPFAGLAFGVGLVALAMALPALTDWDVHVRHFPPLHADWDPAHRSRHDPRPGRRRAGDLAGRSRSRSGCRGEACCSRRTPGEWRGCSASPSSTVATASRRSWTPSTSTSAPPARPRTSTAILAGWIARIPYDGLPDNIPNANWPVHVAGHPPGALGFFVLLDRIGLGSGWWAGVVVTLLAASTALAVHGDAAAARRRGRRPPGRAVPGLRPGRHLAVRQRRRDVRCRRGLGHRRPGRGRRTTQHPLVARRGTAARVRRDALLRAAAARPARGRRTRGGPELAAAAVGGGRGASPSSRPSAPTGSGGGRRCRRCTTATGQGWRATVRRRTGGGATSPPSPSAPAR